MKKISWVVAIIVAGIFLFSNNIQAYDQCVRTNGIPVVPCTYNGITMDNVIVTSECGTNHYGAYYHSLYYYATSHYEWTRNDTLHEYASTYTYSNPSHGIKLYGYNNVINFGYAHIGYNDPEFLWLGTDAPPVLTVLPNPQNGGSVVSTPGGISCSDGILSGIFNCSGGSLSGKCQNYFSGNVSLTATASTNYVFSFWDDGMTNYVDNPLTVTMDTNKTLTAKFFRTFRDAVGDFKQSSGTGGECVPYVRYETEILYSACTGTAANCFGQAQTAGYSTGSSPRIGSIIVFDIDSSKGMPYGHVGVVKSINGNTLTLHDSNWCSNDCQQISEHDVDLTAYNILGYIYFTP
jgi:surface antigen